MSRVHGRLHRPSPPPPRTGRPGAGRGPSPAPVRSPARRAQATREAQSNPQQAAKTLELARSMTQRLGNGAMTQVLDKAIDELGSSKTISLGTAKTMRLGAKTQVLRGGPETPGSAAELPSDEEIRKMTGA